MVTKQLTKYCDECYGTGTTSTCCGDPIDGPGDNCGSCGKFAAGDVCGYCEGYGQLVFEVGQEIDIFVCTYSPKYLKELLFQTDEHGKFKDFTGIIRELHEEDSSATIKVEGKRNKVRVSIEELKLR